MITKNFDNHVCNRLSVIRCRNRKLSLYVKAFDKSLAEKKQYRRSFLERELPLLVDYVRQILNDDKKIFVEVHVPENESTYIKSFLNGVFQ